MDSATLVNLAIIAAALAFGGLYVARPLWLSRQRRLRLLALQAAAADVQRIHDSMQSSVARATIMEERAHAIDRHRLGDSDGALQELAGQSDADAALKRYALRFDTAQGNADHEAMRDIALECYVDPVVPVERRIAMFGILNARTVYAKAASPFNAAGYIKAATLSELEATCAPTPASRANAWRWAALAYLEAGETANVIRCCEAAKSVPALERDHPLRLWVDSVARSALYRDGRKLAPLDLDIPADTLPAVHVYCHVTEAAIAYRAADFDAVERHCEAAEMRARQVTSGDATVHWYGRLATALLSKVTGSSRDKMRALVGVESCPLPGVGIQILALTGTSIPISATWFVSLQSAPREQRREVLSLRECQAVLFGMSSPEHENIYA